ncbi:MAG: glycosyltransferase family 4 protein [Terriglobales bacterium]
MRIGLDLQSTLGEVTGIGAYAAGLALSLQEAASPHAIVPLCWGGTYHLPAPLAVMREQVGLAWQARWQQLDVLHAPGFSAGTWGRAARVLTLHDLCLVDRPELLPVGPSRAYWSQWIPWSARHADLILTPSRFTQARVLALLGLPERRVRLVPYPPRRDFQPVSATVQQQLRWHFHLPQHFVLALGACEPRKDWLGLLRAFSIVAPHVPHDLVLVGRASVAGTGQRVRSTVAQLGLGGRVHLLGYVRHNLLPALYSAASLFVFPELYAGYGLPMLEAMACGTPVLSYANTALEETAAGAACLVPEPHHPVDVAAALRQLLEQPDLRAEWARRGQVRVSQLDWGRTAQEHLAAYEAVLPAARAAGRLRGTAVAAMRAAARTSLTVECPPDLTGEVHP